VEFTKTNDRGSFEGTISNKLKYPGLTTCKTRMDNTLIINIVAPIAISILIVCATTLFLGILASCFIYKYITTRNCTQSGMLVMYYFCCNPGLWNMGCYGYAILSILGMYGGLIAIIAYGPVGWLVSAFHMLGFSISGCVLFLVSLLERYETECITGEITSLRKKVTDIV